MLRNRYRVIERLGAGSGGTVYAVEDQCAGGARLALKALWPRNGDRVLVAALRSEFRVLAALRHPRLGRVYDFGKLPPGSQLPGAPPTAATRGGYFLTRELVDGEDLAAAARERQASEVCHLLADAAQLLDVLHRSGMRHGDFKPANAIVDPAGGVHLIDYGLATAEHARASAGTLPYVAPEILQRGPVDRRADLYALGIVLYELCAGALPSGEASGGELVDWHCGDARPALPNVPDSIAAVYRRLSARDPDERYPTAAEAAAALAACSGGNASTIEIVAPSIPPPADETRQIEQALRRRLEGRGGPGRVDVVGDVGAGKSALLTELTWRLELRGTEVVRADVAAPGGALAAALDQVAALCGAAPPMAGERLARFAAIAQWLSQAARQTPLAILIDDFDFVDETSAELADYLGRALPPDARVGIVVARRPSPGDEAPVAPSALGDAVIVRLPALTVETIGDLIRDAAGRRDDDLAERLLRHTGGNRLHVADTLRALAERGFPTAAAL